MFLSRTEGLDLAAFQSTNSARVFATFGPPVVFCGGHGDESDTVQALSGLTVQRNLCTQVSVTQFS